MLKFCLFIFNIIVAGSAVAGVLPAYRDDAEYDHCVGVTNDYDACANEESLRVLRDIKILYSNLLVHPQIQNWNDSPEANKQVLRDMYESWTAYRNRQCSLAVVATTFMAIIIDTRISCTLYQNFQHKNQLLHILHQLEPEKYPPVVSEIDNAYTFASVYEHDDTYKSCIKDKTQSKENCLKDELQRVSKEIKDFYNTLSQDEFTSKWNNGPDLKNGNYRDMYDSWVAYRNRLCSLNTYVSHITGNKSASQTECALFLSMEHSEAVNNLLLSSSSFLDEEMTIDIEGDGGEAEGKKITPLKRRISSSISDKENPETLENDEGSADTAPEAETVSAPSNIDSKGRKIPAWAQKQQTN